MPISEGEFDPRDLSQFDVVVVPFPYSDRLAEKRRPAVVVSNRHLIQQGLIWVIMVTSSDNPRWPDDVDIESLALSGLAHSSMIRPTKIACIDPVRIIRIVGTLGSRERRRVLRSLKKFLDPEK